MMKYRSWPIWILAIAAAAIPLACGQSRDTAHTPGAPAAEPCRSISHEMGATDVCGQPETIVVLGPNLLDLLLSLGEQPAGFADHMALHRGDYTNPQEQIPYIGDRVTTQPVNVGLDSAPSIETIARIQPDLILGTQMNEGQYAQLSQIAPTLLFDWFDTETNLRAIAQAINQVDQAETLLQTLDQRKASARERFAPLVATHPKVLMLSSGNAQEFFLITPENSFCGALIHDLGFQPVYPPGLAAEERQGIPSLSLELLPQLHEADMILLFGHNWDAQPLTTTNDFEGHQLNTLKQGWETNAIAQSLDASKAGRVYFIPAYLCLGLPGPIGTELYLEALENQLLSPQTP